MTFESGKTDTADIIVCADGIHSVGKDYITRDESLHAPQHTGFCVYYGIVPDTDSYLPDHTARVAAICYINARPRKTRAFISVK